MFTSVQSYCCNYQEQRGSKSLRNCITLTTKYHSTQRSPLMSCHGCLRLRLHPLHLHIHQTLNVFIANLPILSYLISGHKSADQVSLVEISGSRTFNSIHSLSDLKWKEFGRPFPVAEIWLTYVSISRQKK
jgi:hypothetical protein